ncbi:hypothetical protein [Pseudomonas japonica]|uniref:hypothetical protein n=1 Tax=Pseudomonas japonica TaxID=256466 RepID=UPI0015E2EFB2|nr:hypothetical protein [Pseudomonas japonica]MBA1290571.1 hypothetical protein [Pseudomonas japonica]
MNSYDEKHLKLLKLIAAGDWKRIEALDVEEVRTLLVCGYIQLRRLQDGGEELAMHPEGYHYMERLQALKASETARAWPHRMVS